MLSALLLQGEGWPLLLLLEGGRGLIPLASMKGKGAPATTIQSVCEGAMKTGLVVTSGCMVPFKFLCTTEGISPHSSSLPPATEL